MTLGQSSPGGDQPWAAGASLTRGLKTMLLEPKRSKLVDRTGGKDGTLMTAGRSKSTTTFQPEDKIHTEEQLQPGQGANAPSCLGKPITDHQSAHGDSQVMVFDLNSSSSSVMPVLCLISYSKTASRKVMQPGIVVHTCHPSTKGGQGRRVASSNPAWAT